MVFCLISVFGYSQTNNDSSYDYVKAFETAFYSSPSTEIRSASGKPGYKYWQNRADYIIDVELDTLSDIIMGKEIIKYTNNSPDELDFLWLHLDQNAFKNDSKGNAIIPLRGSRSGTKGQKLDGGFKISAVQVISGKGRDRTIVDAEYEVYGTRMKVNLPQKLKPNGDEVSLKIDFSFLSPNYGSDRMGIVETQNGKIYSIAQFHPRMCVYDDLNGWNTLPYIGQGEFYLEYGDFNISITVPSNQIVLCSGELINPLETYTLDQLDRWAQAEGSDEAVMIRTPEEINDPNSRPVGRDMITWRFKMENTRDIAWASSSSFILDAARINLPSGKKSIAISAYPIESYGDNAWERSTEYTKASVEHYSERWFEYPYPTAINIASNVAGIEYPAVSFCSYKSKGGRLWGVTDHEFGHNWFPMIVGSNERLYGWMDEGFNTFINNISTKEFNNGEYYGGKVNMHMAALQFGSRNLEPLITAPDNLRPRNTGLQYYKTAMFLWLLRDNVLGAKRFDDAFKEYIHRWAFKHPEPNDFFRTMEDVSGEDLGWFWRSWVLNNWVLDQAITDVEYVDGDPTKGAYISIKNMREIPMPVKLEITTSSEKKIRKELPVDIWRNNISWKFLVETTESFKKIVLDPDFEYPDVNAKNNYWYGPE
ncbi:MAG: peptidase M1 [Flavobacteriaceae bacterium]|nr:peptidase M1 [Flavobacteriaceae bacterium]